MGDRKMNKNLIAFVLCSFCFLIPAQAEIVNLNSNMDCAQANAGAGTCDAGGTGTGVGTITFDTVTNLLSWNVSHSGLSGAVTAAHFHGPALPDQNAGVQVGIGVPSPAMDSMVLTPAQATDLLAGLWYINIHSTNFPGGEIRGQVDVVSTPACDIQLNQSSYVSGDPITADVFRIANLTAASLALEWKAWLGVPNESPIEVVNVGADGSFVLPAGTDVDFGPVPFQPLSVPPGLPPGSYELSCRLLDPVTGELLTEDINVFEIQSNYAVGDTGPAGGIVFYVTDNGLHGLEAAPVDQGVGQWGCPGSGIPGADGTAIGTGAQNTADILAGCAEPGIAARLVDGYSLNGFDDWFLPSKDELNELYLNRDDVGGFARDAYWSSSEIFNVDNFAWYQSFIGGQPIQAAKHIPASVRAIRAF